MPVPAVQYLRMSTEHQQYSLENQSIAIAEYAGRHGLAVVQTYRDAGKSGISLKRRNGLSSLLRDVVAGETAYKAILVYDVSRWGRFQDPDEAAHYEFICKSAGIPVYYCAESFDSTSQVTSTVLKALKRSMAAEFSRQHSVRVFNYQSRLARRGIRLGGAAAFGLRRRLVSASGVLRRTLNQGEHKSLQSDHVLLEPGPPQETKWVRRIFEMIADRRMKLCEIVAELNRTGPLQKRGRWTANGVRYILKNPAYTGCCAWGRTARKLNLHTVPISPDRWITKQAAFTPLVDKETFDKVQRILQKRKADMVWTIDDALERLSALLKRAGCLSESLLSKARGAPKPGAVRRLFGSLTKMYELVGYELPGRISRSRDSFRRAQQLRERILGEVIARSGGALTISRAGSRRATLLLDGKVKLSVLLCPTVRTRSGSTYWLVRAIPGECDCPTLVCRLDSENREVQSLYMFRRIEWSLTHCLNENDPWLANGLKLSTLSQVGDAAHRLMESPLSATLVPGGIQP